jgi:hypothetical protein
MGFMSIVAEDAIHLRELSVMEKKIFSFFAKFFGLESLFILYTYCLKSPPKVRD